MDVSTALINAVKKHRVLYDETKGVGSWQKQSKACKEVAAATSAATSIVYHEDEAKRDWRKLCEKLATKIKNAQSRQENVEEMVSRSEMRNLHWLLPYINVAIPKLTDHNMPVASTSTMACVSTCIARDSASCSRNETSVSTIVEVRSALQAMNGKMEAILEEISKINETLQAGFDAINKKLDQSNMNV